MLACVKPMWANGTYVWGFEINGRHVSAHIVGYMWLNMLGCIWALFVQGLLYLKIIWEIYEVAHIWLSDVVWGYMLDPCFGDVFG